MNVRYEWDIETLDEYGDIIDHDFKEHYTDLLGVIIKSNQVLVLIRDYYKEGSIYRQWAYVENNKLPDTFTEGAKVPHKFHKELVKIFK